MIKQLFGVSLIFLCVFAKDCNSDVDCGVNASCISPQMQCTCKQSYIGSCVIKAVSLDQSGKNIILKQKQITYFELISQFASVEILIEVCSNKVQPTLIRTYRSWIDNGTASEFKVQDATSSYTQYDSSKCITLYTTVLDLKTKADGRLESIILGIEPSMQINITVSMLQGELREINWLWYLWMSLAVSLLLLKIMGFIFFTVIRRRMRRRGRHIFSTRHSNLSHFNKYMPQTTVEDSRLQPCPICLEEFILNAKMRRTICGHQFHTMCLETWCKQTLNCPVCRKPLDEKEIDQTLKQRRQQFDLADWEEKSHPEIQLRAPMVS